ncbi:MAG: glycosyltransferase [Phycisphaerales bacterium]|jgi:glycosyltransferase involved in cell wall biosynthesis|nr:glycosyltransferase [Phycisphaerales bacterium]MBT7171096.1 glycosyltransferase [Phycisphaerales bacterium]
MLQTQELHIEGNVPCLEYSDPDQLPHHPVVSIKMLTYNHAPYIGEAIESIVNQETDFPFELVIGEDCSPDTTQDIAREYVEKYPDKIRLLTSEANVGICKNDWRVEVVCRGTYLAYCEGDDYWHDPTKLQKQVDLLEANPDCVLVHSDVDFFFQDKGTLVSQQRKKQNRGWPESISPQELYELFLCGINGCYTPSVMVRAKVLDEVIASDPEVFLEGKFPLGDLPRWMELAWRGTFLYIDESLATLRRIGESATRSANWSSRARFSLGALRLTLYYNQKYPAAPEKINPQIKGMGLQALRQACLGRDADLAREIVETLPSITRKHRLLQWAAGSCIGNLAFRITNALAIRLRRLYRKMRYGIESSI